MNAFFNQALANELRTVENDFKIKLKLVAQGILN